MKNLFFHILYKWLAILWYLVSLIIVLILFPFYTVFSMVKFIYEEIPPLYFHFVREFINLKKLMLAPYRENVIPSFSVRKIIDAFFYTLQ